MKEKFNTLKEINADETLNKQLDIKYALDFLLNSKGLFE